MRWIVLGLFLTGWVDQDGLPGRDWEGPFWGGSFLCWETCRNGSTANKHETPCSGGKRNGAQPSRSPHRDGSGRRQIPKLFFGAGKGHRLGSQETRMQPSICGALRIVPAATKNSNQRDLTKGSVSLFSGSSFSKEEPQGVGARSPHPVPRSGSARKIANRH